MSHACCGSAKRHTVNHGHFATYTEKKYHIHKLRSDQITSKIVNIFMYIYFLICASNLLVSQHTSHYFYPSFDPGSTNLNLNLKVMISQSDLSLMSYSLEIHHSGTNPHIHFQASKSSRQPPGFLN